MVSWSSTPNHAGDDDMEELKFNCPAYLAQRFWKHCVDRDDTPGAVLRAFMVNEIRKMDPNYQADLKALRASDRWVIREITDDT